MTDHSGLRRRGDGTSGWSQELRKEEFVSLMQQELDDGASSLKALLKLMAEHNISLDDLKTFMKNIGGFSNAKYDDIAPMFGLDPSLKGTDIDTFELSPVFIPIDLFHDIVLSVKFFNDQYGSIRDVQNEAGVSHFISSILGPLLGLFKGGLLNRPEYTMHGVLSTSGRVEITLFAGPSCVILVGELKYNFTSDVSDILAQVLCEADGADYCNFKANLGACPIYCLIIDKREWKFFKVDFETRPFIVQRASKEIHINGREGSLAFLVDLKYACSHLLSFLLSAYFSGLKAYTSQSKSQSTEWKRQSLTGWLSATEHARKSYDLFLQTSCSNSPDEACRIFQKAHKYLLSSLSVIPQRRPNIDLWKTGVEETMLVNILNHIALGSSAGEPLLAMYLGDINSL